MYLLYRMTLTVYNFMWLKLNKVILNTSAPYYKRGSYMQIQEDWKKKKSRCE